MPTRKNRSVLHKIKQDPHVKWIIRQKRRSLKALAVLCIIGALYYFPLFSPIFQNDIIAAPPPIDVNTQVSLPYEITKPERNFITHLFVHLTTDSDFVVGKPLMLSVMAGMPHSLTLNAPAGFAVVAGEALDYPVQNMPNITAAFPALIPMYAINSNMFLNATTWSGSRTVEYSVTGSFGLTLFFYNYTNTGEIKKMMDVHTDPLFSISSQDSLVLKRSQSLTMTLTFLLLFFVVLDVIRAKKSQGTGQFRNTKDFR